MVSLLACAGHDGQKAHLHVTAEVQSDIGGSILEGKKGEIALVKGGDLRHIYLFICVFLNVGINMEEPSYNGSSFSPNVFVFITDVAVDRIRFPALD